ncbi:MAG: hypothetical protein QG665_144 [Patescibacteria group bacterium]|nr:hypothetical protein [Patescibacteria group bacterium]
MSRSLSFIVLLLLVLGGVFSTPVFAQKSVIQPKLTIQEDGISTAPGLPLWPYSQNRTVTWKGTNFDETIVESVSVNLVAQDGSGKSHSLYYKSRGQNKNLKVSGKVQWKVGDKLPSGEQISPGQYKATVSVIQGRHEDKISVSAQTRVFLIKAPVNATCRVSTFMDKASAEELLDYGSEDDMIYSILGLFPTVTPSIPEEGIEIKDGEKISFTATADPGSRLWLFAAGTLDANNNVVGKPKIYDIAGKKTATHSFTCNAPDNMVVMALSMKEGCFVMLGAGEGGAISSERTDDEFNYSMGDRDTFLEYDLSYRLVGDEELKITAKANSGYVIDKFVVARVKSMSPNSPNSKTFTPVSNSSGKREATTGLVCGRTSTDTVGMGFIFAGATFKKVGGNEPGDNEIGDINVGGAGAQSASGQKRIVTWKAGKNIKNVNISVCNNTTKVCTPLKSLSPNDKIEEVTLPKTTKPTTVYIRLTNSADARIFKNSTVFTYQSHLAWSHRINKQLASIISLFSN